MIKIESNYANKVSENAIDVKEAHSIKVSHMKVRIFIDNSFSS